MSFQAKGEMDLDSPFAKMLDFLDRYTSSRPGRRPSMREASKLQDLIVSHSGALTMPDLENGLNDFSDPIKNYIMSLQPRTASQAALGLLNSSCRSSMFDSDGDIGATSAASSRSSLVALFGGCEEEVEMLSEGVRNQIGSNFFLDTISPASPFARSERPLCMVVKVALSNMDMLASTQSQMKLMRFAYAVEEGYADGGCE
uniref:Uncharacterized protein n=1 Tax=Tetraselmis chuii TaxID=63592 RepID=A0A7S1SYN3_9CHLO|mmetsp:Transcript_35731/g.63719  ORF Transcript_35731/g.63719 Transcript_35731/m.63719 type:complete len:201 (+) Transcript_35731:833-1435(+)